MTNTAIRAFETQLYDIINGVPLSNEVKRLVVENILLKLTTAADADINKELREAENGQLVGKNAEEKED